MGFRTLSDEFVIYVVYAYLDSKIQNGDERWRAYAFIWSFSKLFQ